MFTISMIRPMILSVVNIIISTDTITMIISIRMARSPSEVDSLDSDLIARTLASIDNEEEEVGYEMSIMDYETGMNHSPQVSADISDNDY